MSAYVTDALVSAYDWGESEISDPGVLRKRDTQLLAFQEEQFWTVGWTTTSLDTRAGRELVLEALSLITRNKRAESLWYEEVNLVDINQLVINIQDWPTHSINHRALHRLNRTVYLV